MLELFLLKLIIIIYIGDPRILNSEAALVEFLFPAFIFINKYRIFSYKEACKEDPNTTLNI